MGSDCYHAGERGPSPGLQSFPIRFYNLLIDLHCHTSASDGALSPTEIVDRALAAGIDLLAITDHDSVAGYRAAAHHYTANPGRMKLISGVEVSCRWNGLSLHVVGLGMDCDHPAMVSALHRLDSARDERGRKIGERLAKKGFPGGYEGALQEAAGSQLGRPHFAAWMVDRGHVRDASQAFDRYLGQGKAGDVKAFWPELEEAVGWIVSAGGVAVLAHPLKYRLTRSRLRRLVSEFADIGGAALEVSSGRQLQDQVRQLSLLAREFGLEASAGSDFHRDSSYGPDLGVELRLIEGLEGVWQRWRATSQTGGSEH